MCILERNMCHHMCSLSEPYALGLIKNQCIDLIRYPKHYYVICLYMLRSLCVLLLLDVTTASFISYINVIRFITYFLI